MPPKVAVMVRYRPQLFKAFNATFPDVKNPDGSSSHKDLQDLMVALAPLYDDDTSPSPRARCRRFLQTVFYDGKADDGVEPEVKKAKVQRGVAASARRSRASVVERGIARCRWPSARPARRSLTKSSTRSPTTPSASSGPAARPSPTCARSSRSPSSSFATATLPTARKPITGYTDCFSGLANQKPKLTSEILRNLLVDAPPAGFAPTWADGYAEAGAATLPFLFRDGRGFASFTGLPAGAVDKDGDGLPDVDDFGRFVDGSKKPLTFASPFAYLEVSGLKGAKDPRDAAGRALVAAGGAPLYRYGDASRTMLNALLRDTKTLAAPATGPLLDFVHVGRAQFGDRVDATGSWDDPDHAGKKLTLPYKKFDAGNAPLADLVYAFGRFLALPKVDDYLELTKQLTRDHPAETARLLGAVMKLREIAQQARIRRRRPRRQGRALGRTRRRRRADRRRAGGAQGRPRRARQRQRPPPAEGHVAVRGEQGRHRLQPGGRHLLGQGQQAGLEVSAAQRPVVQRHGRRVQERPEDQDRPRRRRRRDQPEPVPAVLLVDERRVGRTRVQPAGRHHQHQARAHLGQAAAVRHLRRVRGAQRPRPRRVLPRLHRGRQRRHPGQGSLQAPRHRRPGQRAQRHHRLGQRRQPARGLLGHHRPQADADHRGAQPPRHVAQPEQVRQRPHRPDPQQRLPARRQQGHLQVLVGGGADRRAAARHDLHG